MAVKPEMLAAPLQPSTAPRAPAGLNRRCQPWDLSPRGASGGGSTENARGIRVLSRLSSLTSGNGGLEALLSL